LKKIISLSEDTLSSDDLSGSATYSPSSPMEIGRLRRIASRGFRQEVLYDDKFKLSFREDPPFVELEIDFTATNMTSMHHFFASLFIFELLVKSEMSILIPNDALNRVLISESDYHTLSKELQNLCTTFQAHIPKYVHSIDLYKMLPEKKRGEIKSRFAPRYTKLIIDGGLTSTSRHLPLNMKILEFASNHALERSD
jgi:hypothetical protein